MNKKALALQPSSSSGMGFQKYTALRQKLNEQDSEGENQDNTEITSLICQLLPVYYQYRRYLTQMLKQARPIPNNSNNARIAASVYIPENVIAQKARKCQEQKKILEERKKNNGSTRVVRMLVTEKIIQKRRKRLAEEQELMKKYEAQEIEDMIGRQQSTQWKNTVEEQHTFQPRRYRQQGHSQEKEYGNGTNNGGGRGMISNSKQKFSRQILFDKPEQQEQYNQPQNENDQQHQSSILQLERRIQQLNDQKPRHKNLNANSNLQPITSNNHNNPKPKPKPQPNYNHNLIPNSNSNPIDNKPKQKSRILQQHEEDSLDSQEIKQQMEKSNVHVVDAKSIDQVSENENDEHWHIKVPKEATQNKKSRRNSVLPVEKNQKAYQKQSAPKPQPKPHQKTKEHPSQSFPSKSISYQAPQIRINYQNNNLNPHNQCSQSQPQEPELSQDDNFSDIPSKNLKANNMVEVDDTYSEHKAKPYVRHNTPNFDTFSQKVKPNAFFDIQRQKLLAQKKHAEQIHNEISVVLGEEDQESRMDKTSQYNLILQNLEQLARPRGNKQVSTGRLSAREFADSFLSSIRHLIYQLCQLVALAQCYKFIMKNKQYQLLKRLYSQQVGKGPIFAKNLSKGVENLLKVEQKSDIDVVLARIFGKLTFITFDDFGYAFTSALRQNQFMLLRSRVTQINSHQLNQLLSRLFSVWVEINYFEIKIRKIAQTNSMEIGQICTKVTRPNDPNVLDFDQFQKFVYSTNRNRLNAMKIKLLCQKYFPTGKFNEMATWLAHKNTNK